MGAGRTEVLETLFGVVAAESGEIVVDGKSVRIRQPKDAIDAGLALLTEDRKLTGIMGVLSVRDNMIMAALPRYSPGGMLQKALIEEVCQDQRKALALKTPSLNQHIQNLSGGNQQKVLISRWLLTLPEILMIDEPTRGIDVAVSYTHLDVYKRQPPPHGLRGRTGLAVRGPAGPLRTKCIGVQRYRVALRSRRPIPQRPAEPGH